MTAASKMNMRRFQLHRDADETGTSGTGIVAEGCEFTDGSYALTWLSPFKTFETGDTVKTVETLHGHGGKTRIVWIDAMPCAYGIVSGAHPDAIATSFGDAHCVYAAQTKGHPYCNTHGVPLEPRYYDNPPINPTYICPKTRQRVVP